jgi:DNA-binding IclR family transcriptional regulator
MSKIVERTLDLLELFAVEKRPLTLSDIARLLNIPASSCHDVLQAMQARGYLYELAPRAGFYPTLRLQQIGRAIGDHDPLIARADLLMRGVRDKLGDSVLLAKVSGLQATYLKVFEPNAPLRFSAQVGDQVRWLHATSGGKALLARLGKSELAAWLKTARLTALTRHTIITKKMLREEIEIGRHRQWFLNRGESIDDATTLSATFEWNGSLYIITVAGPSSRLLHRIEYAARLLLDLCHKMAMRTPGLPGAGG